MVVVGWQADWPSRGGRLHSPDGIAWSLDRSAMLLDIGIAGGVEDHMIYRQYIANVDGEDYYNTKNQRPSDWIETINVAIWRPNDNIIDPSKWSNVQGADVPNGASFEVRSGRAYSLGNGPDPSRLQTLQGNRIIRSKNYAVPVRA